MAGVTTPAAAIRQTAIAVVITAMPAGCGLFRGSESGDDRFARPGVGITWLSSGDQLWVLSSDVDRAADGTWIKTAITPETTDTVPDEIRGLTGAG
jgi:hypothetical protein